MAIGSQPVGSAAKAWLQHCGYSDASIAEMSASTTLQMDLGLDGDTLEDLAEELASRFSVDMSNFDFDLYSMTEGQLITMYWPHNLVRTALRRVFARHSSVKQRPTELITLDMIERTLQLRRWQTE